VLDGEVFLVSTLCFDFHYFRLYSPFCSKNWSLFTRTRIFKWPPKFVGGSAGMIWEKECGCWKAKGEKWEEQKRRKRRRARIQRVEELKRKKARVYPKELMLRETNEHICTIPRPNTRMPSDSGVVVSVFPCQKLPWLVVSRLFLSTVLWCKTQEQLHWWFDSHARVVFECVHDLK